jgi:hypothetical protein
MLNETEAVASRHEQILRDSESKIDQLEREMMKLKQSYIERMENLGKLSNKTP